MAEVCIHGTNAPGNVRRKSARRAGTVPGAADATLNPGKDNGAGTIHTRRQEHPVDEANRLLAAGPFKVELESAAWRNRRTRFGRVHRRGARRELRQRFRIGRKQTAHLPRSLENFKVSAHGYLAPYS